MRRRCSIPRTDYIFQFESTNHGTVDWQFHKKVVDKMYHATWLVAKNHLVVLTKLDDQAKKEVQQELFETFEKIDNQLVRDHNNKKARERRTKKANAKGVTS
tara:strand:+ start:585 stop:890 length:306 start_codon:yes stop_codon:yes gene_type:complete